MSNYLLEIYNVRIEREGNFFLFLRVSVFSFFFFFFFTLVCLVCGQSIQLAFFSVKRNHPQGEKVRIV